MKINKLAAVIRKIVQEEVQREVKKLITEKVEVKLYHRQRQRNTQQHKHLVQQMLELGLHQCKEVTLAHHPHLKDIVEG